MVVVLKRSCGRADVERLVAVLEGMDPGVQVIQSTGRTLLAAVNPEVPIDCAALASDPAVEHVFATTASAKSPAALHPPARLEVCLGPPAAVVGGARVGVIAGPCSVEGRSQILDVAAAVQEAGAIGLRGGAFKPRTNPYSFQGLGEQALELLAEARTATGLAIVTEVMSPDQLDVVSRYGDVLQIGTRNMHNYKLLCAAGETGLPILLKRGWSATLEEFLHAAECIVSTGNTQVILCERGIRTFESYVRNTLALAVVPAIKQRSPLPIIVDPSHGTGSRALVPPMCKAAVAAGADGLLIEVHPDPSRALTDGGQSLDASQFGALMAELEAVAVAVSRTL